jgi:hypothetical protein
MKVCKSRKGQLLKLRMGYEDVHDSVANKNSGGSDRDLFQSIFQGIF